MESEVEVASPPPRTLTLHATKFGVSEEVFLKGVLANFGKA